MSIQIIATPAICIQVAFPLVTFVLFTGYAGFFSRTYKHFDNLERNNEQLACVFCHVRALHTFELTAVESGGTTRFFTSALVTTVMAHSAGHFRATFSVHFTAVTFAWGSFGKCTAFGWRFLGRTPLSPSVFRQLYCRFSGPPGSSSSHTSSAG